MRPKLSLLLFACTLVGPALAAEQPVAQSRTLRPDEEAPKGLSVVPWKRSEPGALPEGPLRLLDFPLAPLDPEVFRREIDFNKEQQP